MTQYIVGRVLSLAVTTWIAVTMVFLLVQVVPGEPAQAALADTTATTAMIEARREALGLNRPLQLRYLHYITRLFRADLGVSWATNQPVGLMISQQLPATAQLAAASLTVALLIGVTLGVGAACARRVVQDSLRAASSILFSIPVVVSSTLIVWLFAVVLHWLPSTGTGSFEHIILPSIVLGAASGGSLAQVLDTALSSELSQQYVAVAKAKGNSNWRAFSRHAFPVAVLAIIDMVALQAGFMLGGVPIVESVFARPGIGRIMVSAVLVKDLPVVQGVVLFVALLYGVLGLVSDVLRASLDPRIRVSL